MCVLQLIDLLHEPINDDPIVCLKFSFTVTIHKVCVTHKHTKSIAVVAVMKYRYYTLALAI